MADSEINNYGLQVQVEMNELAGFPGETLIEPADLDCAYHGTALVYERVRTIAGWQGSYFCPSNDGTCPYGPNADTDFVTGPALVTPVEEPAEQLDVHLDEEGNVTSVSSNVSPELLDLLGLSELEELPVGQDQ